MSKGATMAGKHRAPKRTHRVRTALLVVCAFLGVMWALGHHAQQQEMATDTLYVCTEEDGSTPGQAFPCLWEAPTQGNKQGTSYVLTSQG